MIIKKFQGKTEKEAVMAAQAEMGSGAVIMHIRTVKPYGIMKLFKKEMVEVTAAVDEKNEDQPKLDVATTQTLPTFSALVQQQQQQQTQQSTEAMEQRLDNIQTLLEQQLYREQKKAKEEKEKEREEKAKEQERVVKEVEEDREEVVYQPVEALPEKEEIPYMRMIFKQLVDNAVEEECANQLMLEVERSLKKDATIDNVIAAVYQKIILKLGEPEQIEYDGRKKKIYFFVGPTGVGKTTTIAKLASDLKMNRRAKLALMTSDTYRIAAVEQLRIYANILEIPLHVIYDGQDLCNSLEDLSEYDTIFVDTAGRSHKNEEHCNELEELLNGLPRDCEYESEVFLVLSIMTKYNDLKNICEKYSKMCKFHIIFTKLDETTGFGNILNVAMLEKGKLSYETSGQNVPDDIDVIDVQKVAKQLLGGVE